MMNVTKLEPRKNLTTPTGCNIKPFCCTEAEKARKRPPSPPLYSTPPHGHVRTTDRTGSPPETPPWVTALMVVLALKAEKPENKRVYFMEERPHE